MLKFDCLGQTNIHTFLECKTLSFRKGNNVKHVSSTKIKGLIALSFMFTLLHLILIVVMTSLFSLYPW